MMYDNSEYERIERAIAKNSKAAIYRVPVQQTSMHIHTTETEPFLKKAKKRFVTFDLETTGLDCVEDQIIEIGAVRVENGEIVARYQQLVDPGCSIPPEATEINGITDDMVRCMPRIYEVVPDVLDFFGNDIVAVHNARFDVSFISQACMRYRFKLHKKYFDTMDLKEYWPGFKSRKLQTFLDAAGIVNNSAHRALGDAYSLAQLIIKTLERFNG